MRGVRWDCCHQKVKCLQGTFAACVASQEILQCEQQTAEKRSDPVIITRHIEPMTAKYYLCGLVHHHGQTLSNGHYTAEVEIDGEWMVCDDLSVSKTTRTRDRMSREAYLLFYTLDTGIP